MRQSQRLGAVMLSMLSGAGAWLVLLLPVIAAGQDSTPASPLSSVHDYPSGRFLEVTSLVFSPDGKRLAAAYYRSAMNRPGTDWAVMAVQWDLATGLRTVVDPPGYRPFAFSPDGKAMAVGICQGPAGAGGGMWPRIHLGLVGPWEGKPFRTLSMPLGDDSSVIAATFNLDGSRVLAVTSSGQLLSWHVQKVEPAEVLDTIKEPALGRSRFAHLPSPSLALSRANELLLAVPPTANDNGSPAIMWRYSASSAKPDAFTLERKATYEAGLITWDAGAVAMRPRAVGLAWPFAIEKGEPDKWWPVPLCRAVAFSPERPAVAFSAWGKVDVKGLGGESLREFPAGGEAIAFSPDGNSLAAADGRGIIRIWDLKTGLVTRTLRLDGRPGNSVLVAAIQCPSDFGDVPANRKRLAGLVRSAARRGASVIVLPEAAVTGYLTGDLSKTWQTDGRATSKGLIGVDPANAAETVPGESTEFFGKLADQLGVYLTVPLVEVDSKTGRYYNTSVLLGPDGRILIHYRKRNPWPWAETSWATDGDRGNPVVDTPFGRLGLLICYDIHQQAAILGRLKVDTLLYSVAWVDNKDSDWFAARLPQIAKANGLNLVAANWTVAADPAPAWHGYGQSRIISSSGVAIAKASSDLQEEIVVAELPIPTAPAGATTRIAQPASQPAR